MDLLFKIILAIHVAGGTIGLMAGTYNMFSKKGGSAHKKIGKIFAISMLGTGFCSLILATMHSNNFLFAVGVFTIYLAGTGWRYLYLKKILEGQKPALIDWFLMMFMIAGSVWLIKTGIEALIDNNWFGIIILLFVLPSLIFVKTDFNTYKGKIKPKNYWLVFHLQRMIGAYIASLTAFVVVNAPDGLSFIPWLLPSAIFVPVIVRWSRKYKVLFTKKAPPALEPDVQI